MRKRVGVERLVAGFVDSIILSIITFIPTAIIVLISIGTGGIMDYLLNTSVLGSNETAATPSLVILTLLELVLGIIYFVVIPAKKNGQTFGKMMLKVKVINEIGENPGYKAHFIRAIQIWGNYLLAFALILYFFNATAFMIVTIIVAFLVNGITFVSIIMLVARTDERGLHDLLADTTVVRVDENLNQDFINKTTQMNEWANIVDGDDEIDKMEKEDDPFKQKDDGWN